MKVTALIAGVVFVTALAVNAALASSNEDHLEGYKPLVTTQVLRTEASLPPVRVPDVRLYLKRLDASDRKTVTNQQRLSRNVLRFWSGKGHWLLASRHSKCWEVPWQRSCTIARASQRLHTALNQAAGKRLFYELPMTNDWQTAVRIVQRVYPGTADWMLDISRREGQWSVWKWWNGACSNSPCLWHGYHIGSDSTGDTVGGWMQFRWSTFAPYWRGAVKDMRARGFLVPRFPDRGGPAEYQPWLDPLGQALTAGYMRYYGKDGCHWCL